jgi:hypothetical protein
MPGRTGFYKFGPLSLYRGIILFSSLYEALRVNHSWLGKLVSVYLLGAFDIVIYICCVRKSEMLTLTIGGFIVLQKTPCSWETLVSLLICKLLLMYSLFLDIDMIPFMPVYIFNTVL